MSDMKCPFCEKPLQPTLRRPDEYWCENYDCPQTNIEWVGSQKLWQELITTRKALDLALDTLERIASEKCKYPIGAAAGTIIRIDQINKTKGSNNE